MNIKKNEFEILSYIEREGGKKLPQRKIADDTMLSLGMVNKSLAELGEMGLIRQTDKKELQITKLGMEALPGQARRHHRRRLWLADGPHHPQHPQTPGPCSREDDH